MVDSKPTDGGLPPEPDGITKSITWAEKTLMRSGREIFLTLYREVTVPAIRERCGNDVGQFGIYNRRVVWFARAVPRLRLEAFFSSNVPRLLTTHPDLRSFGKALERLVSQLKRSGGRQTIALRSKATNPRRSQKSIKSKTLTPRNLL